MDRRDFVKLGASIFTIPAAWAQQAAKLDWTPSVLDSHQNETVIALTELIIPATDTPGAKVANVNRYIDLFLRDGNAEFREKFISGLDWLDGFAIREHGHPFAHCTAADQIAMLHTLDGGSGPGHDFFREAKSLTARIYYATEIGFQELNKGGRVPATFGCEHAPHA
jgi:gluconate 2-dehydrogenase gamma chain